MKQKKILPKLAFYMIFGAVCFAQVFPFSGRSKNKKTDAPDPDIVISSRVDSLEQQLDAIVAQVQELWEQIGQIQGPREDADIYGAQIARLDSSNKALVMVTASMSQDIAKLKRQISQNEQRAVYIDSINYEILTQLVILENRIVSLAASLNETRQVAAPQPRQPAAPVTGDYRNRYLRALALHQNGDNERAIELFRQLLDEDKTHELADNAQYWIGECFYTLKQYRQAIVEFEKVFSFQQTNKDDDAQFKLGLCYLALDDRTRANDELQRLIDYYPQSEFIKNAQQLMK
jgi:TolA-binding protein